MLRPLRKHASLLTITHTCQQIHFIHWNVAFGKIHGSAWLCLWLWLKQLPLTFLKSISWGKRWEEASSVSRWEQKQEALLSSCPLCHSHLFLPVLAGTMRKVRDSQEMLLPDGEVSWSLCQQMWCLDMYWLLSQILSLNLVFSSEIFCRLFHQFELEPSLGLSVLIYGVRKIRILAPSQICWVHSFFFFPFLEQISP